MYMRNDAVYILGLYLSYLGHKYAAATVLTVSDVRRRRFVSNI